jgi:serine/threonine protein phosphatase PrpC
MGVPRVDGGLMISRAFGDFTYKWNTRSHKPPPPGEVWSTFKVTAMPEVERWFILPHHVLILSSDGLLEGPNYTALHPRTVGERVYVAMVFGKSLAEVAGDLLDQHIAKAEAPYEGDDLSVILVTGLGPLPRGGGKRRAAAGKRTRRVRKASGSNKN